MNTKATVIGLGLLFYAALFSISCALADGLEPKQTQVKFGQIRSVQITSQGLASATSADEPKGCAQFTLSKSEVISYLKNSGSITEQDYLHLIDWSVCTSTGKVVFSNGLTGVWTIQKYRGGSLNLSNGKTVYLYCTKCKGVNFRR